MQWSPRSGRCCRRDLSCLLAYAHQCVPRQVPLALMVLNEQYHNGELNRFQWDFLEYFAYKGEQKTHPPPPSIDAFQRWIRIKCGYQVYSTISGPDALRLSTYDAVRKNSRKHKSRDPSLIAYEAGVNQHAINQSVAHFHDAPTISVGDGTRTSRFLGRQGIFLLGKKEDVDCAEWEDSRMYVPVQACDLRKIIMLTRKMDGLGAEVYTEQFRCLSHKHTPRLTYATFMESSSGKSGFLLYKYWMMVVHKMVVNHVALMLVAFVTDHSSVGISGGTILGTPTQEMVDLGCSYLGLPVDDYKYYAVYCRPAMRTRTSKGCTGAGHGTMYRVLPPIMYMPDCRHLWRLVRSNLESLSFLVFFCVRLGDLQGSKVASLGKLQEMSRQRLQTKVPLKDIVTINKVMDFKDDAALHLLSEPCVTLLRMHHPDDTATLLALEASHHAAKVMTEPSFTNASLAVEYMFRNAGVWEMQEKYVRKVSKVDRPSDCLPSHQFRTSNEMLAHSVTNYFLIFHRHFIPLGFTWEQCMLCSANSDELESTHGDGRTGLGNQCNFTFDRWVQILTSLGEEASCAQLISAAGVIMGAPKHKHKAVRGLVKLGTLPYNLLDDITCTGYIPPTSYDDFVQDLIAAREKGIAWAQDKYTRTFGPLCEEQFEASGCLWKRELVPESDVNVGCQMQPLRCRVLHAHPAPPNVVATMLRVREGVDLPVGMCLAAGDVMTTKLPLEAIDPQSLVVPAKVAKKLRELDERLAASSQFLYEDDIEVEASFDLESTGTAETLLGEYERLLAKAKQDRQDVIRAHESRASRQEEHGCFLELSEGAGLGRSALEWSGVVNGSLVVEEDGSLLYTDQVLARAQQRDRVDKDRCRRFIVRRLLNFSVQLQQGHDVMLGSCLLIKWGSPTTFAVVRVLKLYGDENERVYSLKLNRKSRKQHYRVELLVPCSSASDGSQRYKASGWQLGPVAGTMVLRLVDLVPLHTIVPLEHMDESSRHQACLPVTTIADLKSKGFVQIKVNKHGELVRDIIGFDADATPVEGHDPNTRCYACKSCWYDHAKGVIVACCTCNRAYHQECYAPTIKSHNIDTWVCGVCDGTEQVLCSVCHEPYSEHECADPRSFENNEMIQCGVCEHWWHQACHVPAVYPLPMSDFQCSLCTHTQAPCEVDGASQTLGKRARRTPTPRVPKARAPAAPLIERARRPNAAYAASKVDPLDLLGCTIDVTWTWDGDQVFRGVVRSYDTEDDTYHVCYDDGEQNDEDLSEGNYVLVKRPTFKETGHTSSTRNERLAWQSTG